VQGRPLCVWQQKSELLLFGRSRSERFALAPGLHFGFGLRRLLGFFLASVFVSHGCKNATRTLRLKSRKLAKVRAADANLLTRGLTAEPDRAPLAGCPILATYLFLSQGWDSTNLNAPHSLRSRTAPGAPSVLRSLQKGWDSTNLNAPHSLRSRTTHHLNQIVRADLLRKSLLHIVCGERQILLRRTHRLVERQSHLCARQQCAGHGILASGA
jgi:hypothetical protein